MGSPNEKKNESNLPPKSAVGFSDSVADSATESKQSSSSSSSSGISSSEFPVDEDGINKCSSSSPILSGSWPIKIPATVPAPTHSESDPSQPSLNGGCNSHLLKQNSKCSEMEMMKERFAKLLLGEDMSGSGKGVSSALAISNAITNLCATVFGQLWRLEPLPPEKKSMWRREMEWLICVCDHIVELIPSWQTFPDGSKLEIMTCRPRSDLFINLPALRKLDNLLNEILDSFRDTEFWYVDQGIQASDSSDGSSSFRKTLQRQEEKWWLPVPRLPPGGLQECSRKQLDHKRECINQILKAAVSINGLVLTEMEVPESYMETLPKTGRACLGDLMYRYITSDRFSPECLLDSLDLSSEHIALEIANRVEAAIYVWRRRPQTKSTIPMSNPNRSASKSSWGMVRDFMVDGDSKRLLLAERADRLLLCLKQRFPGLTQTTLDTTKIQCNKDVGKSILESYSRVLESLASNILARLDDVLYVDDLTKQSDKSSSLVSSSVGSPGPTVSVIAHKKAKGSKPYSVSVSSTPHKTATTFSRTPNTVSVVGHAKGGGVDRTPVNKPPRPGGGGGRVRRVLTNYLTGDPKIKSCRNQLNEGLGSGRLVSKCVTGSPSSSRTDAENIDPQRVSSSSSSSVVHQLKTSNLR